MLAEIFQKPKPILGQVSLFALPGSHGWEGQWNALTARAEQEATALATGGVDGIIIENKHDGPFTEERMDPAGAIAMALLVRRLKQFTGLPVGISVLRNDPETALAVAINTEAAFIRISVLAGARMTHDGIMNSHLQNLLHYKNRLKTTLPPILADVSLSHLVPHQGVLHQGGTSTLSSTEQAIVHLTRVVQTFPDNLPLLGVVLSDQDIPPDALSVLRQTMDCALWVENHSLPEHVDEYFQQGDGLILAGGIRKRAMLQPNQPPSIDMTLVEEVINRLRGVKSLAEMDPNIFLQR